MKKYSEDKEFLKLANPIEIYNILGKETKGEISEDTMIECFKLFNILVEDDRTIICSRETNNFTIMYDLLCILNNKLLKCADKYNYSFDDLLKKNLLSFEVCIQFFYVLQNKYGDDKLLYNALFSRFDESIITREIQRACDFKWSIYKNDIIPRIVSKPTEYLVKAEVMIKLSNMSYFDIIDLELYSDSDIFMNIEKFLHEYSLKNNETIKSINIKSVQEVEESINIMAKSEDK